METLEDLKAIIAGKPEDGLATYIDDNGDYCRMDKYGDYQYYNGVKWIESGCVDGLHSLSDIERIIELMEWQIEANKNYQSTVSYTHLTLPTICSV